ncbi:MAG: flagellar basal body P-ring formation chaperone FlgA [Planctomycetaceae bacterium]|jgi:flagella basal body P-ring formation protein FlgA|nr:flagellar basal body P-ring formation chaperone FlgA [Planctomycetaceae bacterium]
MFRTFLFLLSFFLFLFPLLAAEIRLKSEPVQCTQTLIALGDVATVVGNTAEVEELRQTVLCVAPQDSETRVFTKNELRSLLSQLGISSSKHQITGAEQITLTAVNPTKNSFIQELPRQSRSKPSPIVTANYSYKKEQDDSQRFVVPAAVRSVNPLRKDNLPAPFMNTLETQIAGAINVFLSSNSETKTTYKITVHLTQEQARLLVTSGQIEDITELNERETALPASTRKFTLQMQKRSGSGEPVYANVEAEVTVLYQAAVLKRSLPKGALISESDVMLKQVDNVKGEVFTGISALTGQETTGSLREGSVITTGMVKKPTWVHKGDIITVRVQNNGIFVRTEGTALQDGTDGGTVSVETIPYKNPSVRGRQAKQEPATFLAKVCAPKTVEVFASPVNIGN